MGGDTYYRIYSDKHIEKTVKDHRTDDNAAGLGYLRIIGEYRTFIINDEEYTNLKNLIEKVLKPFKKDIVEFIKWTAYDGVELSIVKYDQTGAIILDGNIVDDYIERQLSEERGLLSRLYLGSHIKPKKY